MGIVRTVTPAGEFLTLSKDKVVGHSLRTYGEWSYGEVELLAQFLRPDSAMIEAGSNIGSHTLFIARDLCPQGRVYAFEPRRLIFQLLCANMILNGVTNVHAFQLGLGAREEAIAEAPVPLDYEANFGGLAPGGIEGTGEVLRLVELDSMLPELPPIRLLKADVEGYEADLLRGARQLIARDRPLLYMENDRPDKSEELLNLLADYGYRSYWHMTPSYRANNFAGAEVPEDIRREGSYNILCVHRETPISISGIPEITDFAAHPLK